jgi:hypothetical protein
MSSRFKKTSFFNLVDKFVANVTGVLSATSYTLDLGIKSRYFLENLYESDFFILSRIII